MLKSDVQLYDYQKIGRNFARNNKYVLIGDEQGLGKSLQAIAMMAEMYDEVDEFQAVVVCPAMLRNNWVNEVRKFTSLSVAVFSKAVLNDSKIIRPHIWVMSYEAVKHYEFAFGADIVVLDECQYIKNIRAKRTKDVHTLVYETKPERLMALSGTPITNNVCEMFSILKLLSYCPSGSNGMPIKEKSQYAFSCKFSNPSTRTINVKTKQGRNSVVEVTEYKGIRNKDLLKQYLKGKYIRRLSSKVLDLPPLREVNLKVSDRDSVTSKKLLNAFNDWLKEGKPTSHMTQAKVASAMEKVPFTCKYTVDLVAQGEQVVIFSDHIDPARAIVRTLEDNKVKCGLIIGSVQNERRTLEMERFKAGQAKVLVCSIAAASTGFTFTTARHLIFNDLNWVPANMDQAKKRIHRISQERRCFVTYMLQGDIDEKILRAVKDKMEHIKEIL